MRSQRGWLISSVSSHCLQQRTIPISRRFPSMPIYTRSCSSRPPPLRSHRPLALQHVKRKNPDLCSLPKLQLFCSRSSGLHTSHGRRRRRGFGFEHAPQTSLSHLRKFIIKKKENGEKKPSLSSGNGQRRRGKTLILFLERQNREAVLTIRTYEKGKSGYNFQGRIFKTRYWDILKLCNSYRLRL